MIYFFLQILIPLGLMFWQFKRKKHFWLRFLPTLSLFLFISFLIKDENSFPFIPGQIGIFLYYMTGYVFAVILVYVCFSMPFLNLIFYAVGAFVVQNFGHHVFGLIMRVAGISLIDQYSKPIYLLFLSIIYLVVFGLVFLVFVRRMELQKTLYLPTTATIGISSAFFLVLIICGIYIRHIRYDIFDEQIVAIIYQLYSALLGFFIIAIQLGVFRSERLKENNKELEFRLNIESHYYKIAQENMEAVNIKSHDIKHQINSLKSISDSELRLQYIKEIENDISMYESIAKTGNEALDYILTEKGIQCRKNHIEFTVMADGNSLSILSYNDIYCLFGNAIDNAIEASLKIEDHKKRLIALKVFKKNNLIIIHLDNYCDEEPMMIDGLPQTTKKGSTHGYGTKSIKYIVDKYNGNMQFSYKNRIFSLDILFFQQS